MSRFWFIRFAVTCVLFCITASQSATAKYGGGSGKPNDPYLISEPNHINQLHNEPNDLDKHFLMTADISMSGHSYTTAVIAIDTNNSTFGFQGTPFTGTFDGNHYKIINLAIDTNDVGNDRLGFIGQNNPQGVIKNLGVEDFNITGGDNSYTLGSFYLGGLCGYNNGDISNCHATGHISGYGRVGGLVGQSLGTISECYSRSSMAGDHYVGGLVGQNHGTVKQCHSNGTVSGVDHNFGGLIGFNYYGTVVHCYSRGFVSGNGRVGGLVGGNYGGMINQCYSSGSVMGGGGYTGGLLGENVFGTVKQCYSTGLVNGNNAGGLVGRNYSGNIGLSFWDVESSGIINMCGDCYKQGCGYCDDSCGRTTKEMMDTDTFLYAGWDFLGEITNGTDDIWRMCVSGVNYPRFNWEYSLHGDFGCPDGTDFYDLAIFTDQWLLEKLSYDINGDYFVNFLDFAVFVNSWQGDMSQLSDFASQWLQPSAYSADIAPVPGGDGIVNFQDFALFADYWLNVSNARILYCGLDNNPNWTTQGQWAFGQPTGNGGAEWGNPDPTSGYTGSNVYGVNLNGDYSLDVGGPYNLTAGPFDCGRFHDIRLIFARWLNTDEPDYVASTVEVSNDGANWYPVWEHTEAWSITDSNWQILEYDVSETADNEPTVYFRWCYEILDDRAYPYSGWNIDDVELLGKP